MLTRIIIANDLSPILKTAESLSYLSLIPHIRPALVPMIRVSLYTAGEASILPVLIISEQSISPVLPSNPYNAPLLAP